MNVITFYFNEIIASFNLLFKNIFFLLLFIASLIIIIFSSYKDKRIREYSIFSLIVILILFNPIFYIIVEKVYGGSPFFKLYYYRFFYVIPFNLTISFALVYVIRKMNAKYKYILFSILIIIMAIFGKSPINRDLVIASENTGKIPKFDYDISNVFKDNNINGYKRVVVPLKTNTSIKQINPDILLVEAGLHQIRKIDVEIDNKNADIDYITKYANIVGVDYISLINSENNKTKMIKQGYTDIGVAGDYLIFSNSNKEINHYDDYGYITTLTINDDNYDFNYINIYRDNYGRIVKEELLDENKNAIVYNGYSYLTKEYDKDGQLKVISYFDENDNLVNTNYGFSSIVNEYENGKIEKSIYYDSNNNITKTIYGEYYIKYNYDDNNCLISKEYFDNNDKLVNTDRGYSKETNTYDSDGRIIKTEYLSSNLDLSSNIFGITSIEYIYSEGKLIETKYHFINDKEKQQKYNRILHTYEDGIKINNYYLDNELINITYEIEMPKYLIEIYEYLDFDKNVKISEIDK